MAALAIVAAGLPSRGFGAQSEVKIIVDAGSQISRDLGDAAARSIPNAAVVVDVYALGERKPGSVLVTIGANALKLVVAARLPGPILSLFATKEQFSKTAADFKGPGQLSAIFSDIDPSVQMRAAHALFSRRIVAGILIGPSYSRERAHLQQLAAAADIELQEISPDSAEGVAKSMAQASGLQALILLPEPSLLNGDNLRVVLETAYRRGIPVVGFSAGLLRAGAAISAFQPSEYALFEAASVVKEMASGGYVPPAYPVYYQVAANDGIAKSLNIASTRLATSLTNGPRK